MTDDELLAALGGGEVKHGGKRAGAGRKPAYDVKWLLRLSKDQRAKVKALGGAEWLRGVIDRAEEPKPWV